MFRNEVTRLDAITAILCIESSMTTSAIVDSVGNALHSNFMENPDMECILSSWWWMYLSFVKFCPCIFILHAKIYKAQNWILHVIQKEFTSSLQIDS